MLNQFDKIKCIPALNCLSVFVSRYAFYRICKDENPRTIRISLKGNRLQTDGVWKILSMFQHQENGLCALEADLSGNRATHFMGDAIQLVKKHLENDEVAQYHFWKWLKLDLRNNEIQCDCALIDEIAAIKYISSEVEDPAVENSTERSGDSNITTAWKDLECHGPTEYVGMKVSEFEDASQPCPLGISHRFCPKRCSCEQGTDSKQVNCSGRQLQTLPPVFLNGTTDFDMSYNNLTVVSVSLVRLQHLRTLDLSHNLLQYVDETFLYSLSTVENLFLHDNHLQVLPLALFKLSQLKNLTLGDNPMRCSCEDANWIIVTIEAQNVKGIISDWDRVRCQDGRMLSNFNLTELEITCSNVIASYHSMSNQFQTMEAPPSGNLPTTVAVLGSS